MSESTSASQVLDREVLLVEYQKAQDSAEHHDAMVSNVTSLLFIGSAVLMGFVLAGVESDPNVSLAVALVALSVTGIVLSVCVWLWARQLREVKIAKYARCKEIEKLLGMTQHSSLRYRSGSQTRGYSILMVAVLGSWVVLVVLVFVR